MTVPGDSGAVVMFRGVGRGRNCEVAFVARWRVAGRARRRGQFSVIVAEAAACR